MLAPGYFRFELLFRISPGLVSGIISPMAALHTLIGDNVLGFEPGQFVAVRLNAGRIVSVLPAEPQVAAREAEHDDPGVLDCRGKLLLPGLIDAHVHAIATGMLMLTQDVREVTSLDALADAIRSEASKGKDVVRLGGLDRNRLPAAEQQRLNQRWLDDLVPARPLFLKSIEGHSAWFNSRAWEQIGADGVLEQWITGGAGGPARQDAGTAARATEAKAMRERGRIHGHAYEELTTPQYDSFSFAERREAMRLVLAEAARVGLTGIHCLEGYGEHPCGAERDHFDRDTALLQRM